MSFPASWRAPALLLALWLIWGYNWVVMKQTLAFIGPFQFGALRTFLAAMLLMLILWLLKRPLTIGRRLNVAVIGVLQTSGFTGLIIWALVEGGAGKVAVLTYTMPFWVMLLAWPMLGEKPVARRLADEAAVTAMFATIDREWGPHGLGGLVNTIVGDAAYFNHSGR